jgi:putative transport protein
MWQDIVAVFRDYPQIVVFLALATGYFVGRMRFFGFNLGSTAGVLLAALILGQMDITVTPLLKTVSFALFIFTIGYKVGPQFFGALKKEGLHYVWMSLFFAVIGLLTAVALAKVFGFDKGTAAGMLAGALTQSSVIGTADGAIKHLTGAGIDKSVLESNVAIAYAITYVFGTAGLVVFFKMVPRIMGIDLKKEAVELEKEMSGSAGENGAEAGSFSWAGRLILRAYRVEKAGAAGKTVDEIKKMFPEEVAVDRIRRGDRVFEPELDTEILQDDILAVVGSRHVLFEGGRLLGPEVYDEKVANVTGEILKVCVTDDKAVGRSLGDIFSEQGHGCFIKSIYRQGQALPVKKNLKVKKCDLLQVAGGRSDVERLVSYLGYPERPTMATDLVMVGLGCVVGTLLGLAAVKVAGVPVTLGVGGGVLVAGLFAGWLRALHPTFGQIPGGAQWVFTDLGLNLFIACVGLTAGPKAIHAIRSTGISLFMAGAVLTLVPHVLSVLFGRYVLRLNPVLLFGSLTGAGTITAALNALKEEADSTLPALGYTVPYAFGNVLLTVWGTLLVYII